MVTTSKMKHRPKVSLTIETPVVACRLRVNRVDLAVGRPLPVYPEQQTFFAFVGMFQRRQQL